MAGTVAENLVVAVLDKEPVKLDTDLDETGLMNAGKGVAEKMMSAV